MAAIGDQAGVVHALGLLREEIHRDMALLGVCNLSDLGREQRIAA